jgi:hypothetical protein
MLGRAVILDCVASSGSKELEDERNHRSFRESTESHSKSLSFEALLERFLFVRREVEEPHVTASSDSAPA